MAQNVGLKKKGSFMGWNLYGPSPTVIGISKIPAFHDPSMAFILACMKTYGLKMAEVPMAFFLFEARGH